MFESVRASASRACTRMHMPWYSGFDPADRYRGTSLIRNSPPHKGFHRALGIVLL